MAEFNWTVDDIKRAQRDFSNNFMRLDCIRTESYDVAIDCMTKCIEKKAADVQPVNQWISVKDRLPEPEKEVLVWYRYTWGDAPTSYGFGINRWYSDTKRWREGCLLKGVEVLFWQRLPEPPKEGDTE
jgi:hypothetical protein